MMQGGMVGLLFLLASGTTTLAFIDGEPLTFEKTLLLCLAAGSLGALFGYCVVKPTSIQDMARQAGGNIALAVIAGPVTTRYVAFKFDSAVTPELLLLVAGLLGTGSVLIVRALGPVALKTVATGLPFLLNAYLRSQAPAKKPRYPRVKRTEERMTIPLAPPSPPLTPPAPQEPPA